MREKFHYSSFFVLGKDFYIGLASKKSHGVDFNGNSDHSMMNGKVKSPKTGTKMIFNQKWIQTWLICYAIWKSCYFPPKFFSFKIKTSLPWNESFSNEKGNLSRCVEDICRRCADVQKIFEDIYVDIRRYTGWAKKKTHPKLIEWCLKVGIYKSKNLLNVVYVIYFGIFCNVSSQKIKHWTSYEIFSDGVDVLLAEK